MGWAHSWAFHEKGPTYIDSSKLFVEVTRPNIVCCFFMGLERPPKGEKKEKGEKVKYYINNK